MRVPRTVAVTSAGSNPDCYHWKIKFSTSERAVFQASERVVAETVLFYFKILCPKSSNNTPITVSQSKRQGEDHQQEMTRSICEQSWLMAAKDWFITVTQTCRCNGTTTSAELISWAATIAQKRKTLANQGFGLAWTGKKQMEKGSVWKRKSKTKTS